MSSGAGGMAQVLNSANTGRTLKEVFSEPALSEADKASEVVAGLIDLWHRRLIILRPCRESQT